MQQKVLRPFRNQVSYHPSLVLHKPVLVFEFSFLRYLFPKREKGSYSSHILLQVGGTILAAKLAKERGWAINVGGGFHHCSGNNGGGFCAYADISLCIHFAFVRLNISR